MSTAWTQTAQEICTDALEHLGVIADGGTIETNDLTVTMKALDAIIKEMPLYGYSWPKMSAETALTWSGGQTIALPDDFYDNAIVWKTVGTSKSQLTQIPHGVWVTMPNREDTGVPTHYYIGADKNIYFWPVPTVDPVATLQYQKIQDDSVAGTTPDVLQIWKGALGYGVADRVSMKYIPANAALRQEISARWATARNLAIQNSQTHETITIEVLE